MRLETGKRAERFSQKRGTLTPFHMQVIIVKITLILNYKTFV